MGGAARVTAVLKRDALGRVELLEGDGQRAVRRVACGGRLPLSALVARALLARERRALAALEGLDGVPHPLEDPSWSRASSEAGAAPHPRGVLVRSFVEGAPLHRAESLPEDFFDHLAVLVGELHARRVCHNDLHKEQNVIVRPDGRPALIDFQLASVHATRGRAFASRVHDDLRHVDKHRRRYLQPGRGPQGAPPPAARRAPRSTTAALWRRVVKPLYNAVTRGLLRTRDGEERRPSSGPWPRWSPPLGPARRPGD
jgi:RIO-like serine/threonine protein kinase